MHANARSSSRRGTRNSAAPLAHYPRRGSLRRQLYLAFRAARGEKDFLLGQRRKETSVLLLRGGSRFYPSADSILRLVRTEYRCDVPRVPIMSVNSSQSILRKSFSSANSRTIACSDYARGARVIVARARVLDCGRRVQVELLTCNRKCEEFVD